MKNIIDFYKKYNRLPFTQFADPFRTPNITTLERLKQKAKQLNITINWDDIDEEAHAKAFTVAKIMVADVLQEIIDMIIKAQIEGMPFQQFKEEAIKNGLLQRMQDAGWTGKSPSRLKVIYDTNQSIAYAQGQYKAMKNIAIEKPYWIYQQIQRSTKRHDHSLLHNKKFKHDDPIWNIIFPPSGFGCSCTVVPVSAPDGLENGNDYIDKVNNNENFQFSPLKPFKPDTNKYNAEIENYLKQTLKI